MFPWVMQRPHVVLANVAVANVAIHIHARSLMTMVVAHSLHVSVLQLYLRAAGLHACVVVFVIVAASQEASAPHIIAPQKLTGVVIAV